MEVTLQREHSVSLLTPRSQNIHHPPRDKSVAKPEPHPQGPDGVQILGRCSVLLGDGLAGCASKGLACDELVREERMSHGPLGGKGPEEKGPLISMHL